MLSTPTTVVNNSVSVCPPDTAIFFVAGVDTPGAGVKTPEGVAGFGLAVDARFACEGLFMRRPAGPVVMAVHR